MALAMLCRTLPARAMAVAAPLVPKAVTAVAFRSASSAARSLWLRPEVPNAAALASRTLGFQRSFVVSAVKEAGLTSALDAELQHENSEYETPEGVSSGPPTAFKLKEEPGSTLLTLIKEQNGETIKVEADVNDQPADESLFDEEPQEEEEEKVSALFNVNISKAGQDKALVFEVRSDGTFLEIIHVGFEPKEASDSESVYSGPVYQELDEALQIQFEEYLQERGITSEFGGYLLDLIHDKEQREYVGWLQNVRNFVKS